MRLTRFDVHRVRNLQKISLNPHPQFNLFWGKNGSGKTSFLEAIHLLGLGRSFRSRDARSVIHYMADELACYGEVLNKAQSKTAMGIEKSRQGKVRCKVAGESCDKLSQFATILPLQLLTPDTFKLLLAGPEERRRYLDWGVFHVEPAFALMCQRYLRLLKQRNAALKQPHQETFQVWERELAIEGEKINACRRRYFEDLLPFIHQRCEVLLPMLKIEMQYEQGWPENLSLEEAFRKYLAQDRRLGFTGRGPHRGELTFQVEGFAASHVLSRGQQKLLICALHMAQARHLASLHEKHCLYLLDDLGSELDSESKERVITLLANESHQVFLTGVTADYWPLIEQIAQGERFHVEHGRVKEGE